MHDAGPVTIAKCRSASSCIRGWAISTRPLPFCLARYIARSASRSRSSEPLRAGCATAMPMLTLAVTSVFPRWKGARSWVTIRPATRSAVRGIGPDPTMSANSSPPSRARRSPWRVTVARRRASAARSWSPNVCPSASLTVLKSSTSRSSTAIASTCGSSVRRATSSRLRNSVRLASPVRLSCSRWKSRSSSVFLRSVMSSTVPTSRGSPCVVDGVRRARVDPSDRSVGPQHSVHEIERPSAFGARLHRDDQLRPVVGVGALQHRGDAEIVQPRDAEQAAQLAGRMDRRRDEVLLEAAQPGDSLRCPRGGAARTRLRPRPAPARRSRRLGPRSR